MKTCTVIAALALSVSPVVDDSAARIEGIRADYVEARTASVFAGACHYGSEYTTTGREAVLAWRLTAGSVDGVSLEGVDVVVAVASKQNLAIEDAERWSVVHLSKDLTPERAEAALAWLGAEHAAALGDVRAVERTDVSVRLVEDTYAVRAGEGIELSGTLLPNRECCAMPHKVWYRPFEPALDKPLVGEVTTFRCASEELGRSFTLASVNCVFVGRRGTAASE